MKKIFDLLVSFSILLVSFPLFIILYILVRFNLGQPVIFSQPRPGLNGKIFRLYKFRSMTDQRNSSGVLESDSVRITTFGKTLRSLSLDELPSLWNVLKGDMSLVGPRPLLVEYLPLYTLEQAHRHNVKPGITGWAQVNGRNAISWEEKFEFDIFYVENQSFWLDVKILLLTVKKVFIKEGIIETGQATASKFTGTRAPKESGSKLDKR